MSLCPVACGGTAKTTTKRAGERRKGKKEYRRDTTSRRNGKSFALQCERFGGVARSGERALFGILETFTEHDSGDDDADDDDDGGAEKRDGVKMGTTMTREFVRGSCRSHSRFSLTNGNCLIVSPFGIHLAETRKVRVESSRDATVVERHSMRWTFKINSSSLVF